MLLVYFLVAVFLTACVADGSVTQPPAPTPVVAVPAASVAPTPH